MRRSVEGRAMGCGTQGKQDGQYREFEGGGFGWINGDKKDRGFGWGKIRGGGGEQLF